MNFDFRKVVATVFDYWGCPWHEEIINLFRVNIVTGTPASEVLEAQGTTHVGLVPFEDDVVAAYPNWRSLAPGSYYRHRLMEYMRGLSPIGSSAVLATSPSLPASSVMPVGSSLGRHCAYVSVENAQDRSIPVLVFHFTVRLIGVEPVAEFISIPVELVRMNVLEDRDVLAQTVPQDTPIVTSDCPVEDAFDAAVRSLHRVISHLLSDYEQARVEVTRRAISQIRSARDADLKSLTRRRRDSKLLQKREEILSLWLEREKATRARARAERVEFALVALTWQQRPFTVYRGQIGLPGGRTRSVELFFDKSTTWLEPLRCEVCHKNTSEVIPGDGPCLHLMCDECTSQFRDCNHVACPDCCFHCASCGMPGCPICSSACLSCGRWLCHHHAKRCKTCGSTACPSCPVLRCPVCKRRVCRCQAAACPVCDAVTCRNHLRHRGECFEIWMEHRVSALTEALGLQDSSEPLGSIGEWFAPFSLSKTERVAVARKLVAELLPWADSCLLDFLDTDLDVTFVSLDDSHWWLLEKGHLADPVLQEYGFAPPSGDEPDEGRIGDPASALRRGWFTQDYCSDPTRESVPEYTLMAVEDGGPPLPNGTSTSEDFDGQECAELVAAALQTLTPREEQVLRALYGFAGLGEWSYAAVARRYRHSTKTIRKIKETALRKLRHPSRSRRLREFWES